jgi:hypothetical protein
MKILINENKVQSLVNKLLDEEFGELYEYKNYTTDSSGEWMTIHYSKEGRVVMIYRDDIDFLYVGEDNLSSLNVFDLDYTAKLVVVSKWFESRYELPVEDVRIVNSKILN